MFKSNNDGPNKELRDGHMFFTNAQTDFYKNTYIDKINKIDYAFTQGTLPKKQTRNPILGEKSARPDYSEWNFKPPTANEEPEKWKVPEEPFPLIANFRTQKDKYMKDHARMKEIKNAIRNPVMTPFNYENTSTVNLNSSRQQQQEFFQEAPDSTARSNISTIRESSREFDTGRLSSRFDLTKQSACAMKELGKTHPEIVAKYRAERAANFVKTQTTSTLDPIAETARIKEKLTILEDELGRTEQLIARQKQKNSSSVKRHQKNSTEYQMTDSARRFIRDAL